jgi:hypothetical protein
MAQYVEGQSGKKHGCLFYGCMTTLGVAVVVAAGIGVMVYSGYSGQQSARGNAEGFLDLCASGDHAKAYELLGSAWRERVTAEQFADTERAAAASRGACEQRRTAGVSMQRATGKGSRATLEFDARCGGKPTRIEVTMVKEAGGWRVEGIDYRSLSELLPLTCAKCGEVSPPGTNFCPRCGEKLQPLQTE